MGSFFVSCETDIFRFWYVSCETDIFRFWYVSRETSIFSFWYVSRETKSGIISLRFHVKHQIVIWAQTKLLIHTYVWPVKAYRAASGIREIEAHQELPLNFWCIYTQTVRLDAGKPSEHFNDIYNNIGIKINEK